MILNQKLKHFLLMAAGVAVIGCSSDSDEILGTDDGDDITEEATIRITQGGATDDKFEASVTGAAASTTMGRVILKGDSNKQRRLYVTRERPGEPAEPYIIPELDKKSTKADGSIDLDGETKNELDFTFDLDTPSTDNGEIIYRFWTTSGRGDFRDPTKRLVAGIGTITVKVGTGNGSDELKSFSNVKLAAPAADGTSPSFFSLFNGTTYKISEGIEFASFWDFGYFHLDGNGANIASTSSYNPAVVNVPEKSSTPETELNKTYFKLKGSGVNFDTVTMSSDLNNLSVSDTDSQTISSFIEGDVIEFLTRYGNKGLIKVKQIKPGFSPSEDFIIIDIKVQP